MTLLKASARRSASMRVVVFGCLIGLGLAQAAYAQPASAGSQTLHTAARYSTTETRLGVLLDDPAARAVLQRYIPEIIADWRIGMARNMTLKTLQPRTHGHLTDQDLVQIDSEFVALAPSQ
jgi:para-nitrobenzyl esterase